MSIKNLQVQSFATCSSCLFLPTTAKHFDWAGPSMIIYMYVVNDMFEKKIVVINFVKILDIPAVHWVIQLDCPEDANTYIHRAGRTARWVVDLVLSSRSDTGSRRGLWSLIPTLFSQESCIKDVCFRWIDLYPKISFSFPIPAKILASPTSLVAVKSCIPSRNFVFSRISHYIWSNPGLRE